ncbi:MAG: DDE-type integrase/transposase/recombinase [Candidatus Bathyarchaeia archaeon]
MSAFTIILDLAKRSGVFKRNKVPLELKVLAALLYFSGLSYRRIASLNAFKHRFSYWSVRYWYLALRQVLPKPKRKPRSLIAIDETKTKLVGSQVYVWAARDVESREILAFRVSFSRSILDAELFLKEVLKYCEEKPLFLVDKGPWYPDAFRSLGLAYKHERFGMRNRIERWFRNIES